MRKLPPSIAPALLWSMALSGALLPAARAQEATFNTWGRVHVTSMAELRGGRSRHAASSALLQWGGRLDTGASRGWAAGQVEFSVEDVRAAGDLPARTGAVQIPNNEWAPDFLRLYQLSYRQQLGAAAVRVGIMDFSQYFDANEQAALLQNSSFGPAANFTNVQAPTFPNPGLGAMAEYRFNPQWSARAGVWQGDPPGLRAVFRRGALWLGELAHDGPTGGQGSPPSVLKLGVWHESQRDPAVGPATSGAYLVGERRWTRGARQWGSFVLAGTSPSQPNLVTQFLAAGFVVTGPWAGRPQDRLSLGVSRVNLRAPAPETVLEAVYSWQLSPRLALQPDVQRFWHPGGGEPGTVVAGLRLCWEAAP